MSPFEMQTLEIARGALIASWVADTLATVALIISSIGGWLVYRQLSSARWNSLLTLEQDMQKRRDEFRAFAEQSTNPPVDREIIFNSIQEGYFNALDRLASSILNGQFPRKVIKQDYQEYILCAVRQFPEELGVGTKYRNVRKLYEKWQVG